MYTRSSRKNLPEPLTCHNNQRQHRLLERVLAQEPESCRLVVVTFLRRRLKQAKINAKSIKNETYLKKQISNFSILNNLSTLVKRRTALTPTKNQLAHATTSEGESVVVATRATTNSAPLQADSNPATTSSSNVVAESTADDHFDLLDMSFDFDPKHMLTDVSHKKLPTILKFIIAQRFRNYSLGGSSSSSRTSASKAFRTSWLKS